MSSKKLKLLAGFITILAVPFFFPGCSSTSTDDSPETRYYEFTSAEDTSEDDNFIAKTSDPQVIENVEAQLELSKDERGMHINGEIARGNDGYNKDWSWHFVPGAWSLAEISIEVCDGNPQMVEENLDYWIEDVGRFCPWSSIVLQEVEVKEDQ